MQLTQREQDAFDAYETHRTQRKAAEAMGITRRSFRRYFDSAKGKLLHTPLGFKTTKISTDKNGDVTAMTHKLAPEIDHVKRTGPVIKTSTLYGADGSVVGEWVIRQPEKLVQNDMVEALDKYFVQNVRKMAAPVLLNTIAVTDDLATFLSVDDHFGVRLTKMREGRDYGLSEAIKYMTHGFTQLIDRTPKSESCMYVNLGDKFHANDHMDVTPGHKHMLRSDTDFDTVSDAVVQLEMDRITQLLSKYEFVNVRAVRGNHDIDPSGWLYRCLNLAFKNEPRVNVQFYADGLGVEVWGTTFMGFHHGDKMKPEVMAGACADRFNHEYGTTEMRYLHTGHVHHDHAKEIWGGFLWESHRTAVPKDRFSYEHGYVSRQVMKSIVYNKKEGEVGRYQVKL
jgi:hypothetical protein